MKLLEFRPCIDLHDGKVKQIVGSTLGYTNQAVVENFISQHDASYYAQMFAQDRLTGGHVIMLGSGNEDAALSALTAYPQGLQIGGASRLTMPKSILTQVLRMSLSHPIFSMMVSSI